MFIKISILTLLIVIPLCQLISCQGDITTTDQINENKLLYIDTRYGGCNGITVFDKTALAKYERNDTVYYAIRKDTLAIFIGLNYICCAPFRVQASQEEGQYRILVKDTCRVPYESCYCRCMCYYEFTVNFVHYQPGEYHLSIYLYDPREGQERLIRELVIS